MGNLNIQYLPWGARYVAQSAYKLAGQQLPTPKLRGLIWQKQITLNISQVPRAYYMRVEGPDSLHTDIKSGNEEAHRVVLSIKGCGL